MSQSVVSTVGAWLALIAGIWFLFEKSEQVASPDTRARVRRWVRNLDPAHGLAQWPETFVRLFDRVFGDRSISVSCVVRSWGGCLGTIAVLWLTRFTIAIYPDPLPVVRGIMTLPSVLTTFVVLSSTLTLPVVLISGYLSVVETRWIIGRIARRPTVATTGALLVLDVVMTAGLGALGTLLGVILYSYLLMFGFIGMPLRYAAWVEPLEMSLGLAGRHVSTAVVYGAGAEWFYSPFFASAWVWLYAFSGMLLRLAARLGGAMRALSELLDIDGRPITSIGWVAMVVATIIYWGVTVGARYWTS